MLKANQVRGTWGPGMLIILPFFFALGFAFGYFLDELSEFFRTRVWTRIEEVPQAINGALPNILNWFAPALAILVLVLTFGFFALPPVITIARLLELAAAVVGALAARWFVDRRGSRDQLAFIAGASAFLFLGALEYDHKLFRNLSKIGGSEFSVEFSAQTGGGNTNDRSTLPVDPAQGFLGLALPGTNAVDLALNHLSLLPKYIVDDERYSALFSVPAPANNGHSTYRIANPIFEMPLLTKQYLNYTCGAIFSSIRTVSEFQKVNAGEFSLLSIPNPEVVLGLLRVYFGVENTIDPKHSAPKDSADLIQLAKGATDQLGGILEARDSKIDPGSLTARYAITDLDFPECREVSRELGSRPLGSPSFDQPSVVERVGYYPSEKWLSSTQFGDDPDPTGLLAYSALAYSLVDFAVGARETAIQFLENEINRLRKGISRSYCRTGDAEGQCKDRQSLHRVRSMVMLTRLDYVRNTMMNLLPSTAIDLIKVRRWIQSSKDYGDVLDLFDPDGSYRKSLMKTGIDDRSPAPCAPQVRALGVATSSLFGRFVLADVSVKNNALNIIPGNPGIVSRKPVIVRDLDRFANDVATFDLDCPNKLIGKDYDFTTWRPRFLDSVGGYWLAKGQNFGATDDDPRDAGIFDVSQNERTKSLCQAKIAYLRAADFAKATTDEKDPSSEDGICPLWNPPDFLNICLEVAKDNLEEFPYRLQINLHHTNLAISNLPAGDVAAVCKSE
jgi:hypothetical protein